MARNGKDELRQVDRRSDIQWIEPTGSEFGSGAAGEVLKRLSASLSDCRAKILSLASPWVCHIPAGWFCLYSVCSGACQLKHGDRFSIPLQIRSGDTIILPQCGEHRLRDSETTEWSHSSQMSWFDDIPAMGNASSDDGSSQIITKIVMCGFPKLNASAAWPLHVLPKILIGGQHDLEALAAVKSTINVLEQEIKRASASPEVIEHLAKALILQMARGWNCRSPVPATAIQAMAADRQITKSIELMRSRFGVAWTLASLANAVGVSRSTFAAKFVDQVGMTPLSYLRQERMRQAADLLCDESLGIKEVSMFVGYSSESAFNSAFKQWSGVTPGLFRRDHK